jgi:hypothetical protein
MAHHRLYAPGEGVGVYAALGLEQGPIDVEEIGVAVVPAKSIADNHRALSRGSVHPAGLLLH